MNQQELFIQMALGAWNTYIARTDKFIDGLSDEELYKEIAPGKNRIVYLLGHLIAVHDNMIVLFGLGNRSYAQLDAIFLNQPDKAVNTIPEPSALRSYWKKVNEELSERFSKMTADDWFSRHSAISEEDFRKEPVRNKLNVLINRTNHLSYHLGQLMLVKK